MRNMQQRREMRDLTSRFKAGLLAPVMAQAFLPGEGGSVSQTVTFELDPVAGRVITPMYAEVTAVFVPVTAIERLLAPTSETADIPEVVKQKYLTGAALYGLEAETEISKRLGVVPQKISGTQQVCSVGRLAYIAAVNFLRKRKYAYAVEELHTSTAIHRAILSETVLDRLRGVLNPAEKVNGEVTLDIGTMDLPVKGIVFRNTPGQPTASTFRDTDGSTIVTNGNDGLVRNTSGADIAVKSKGLGAASTSDVTAAFDGQATGINLVDFYKAENHDKMLRIFAQMVKDNPQDGEEAVMRYVYGFSMEPGRHPLLVHQSKVPFGVDVRQATDNVGLQQDAMMSKGMQRVSFTAIIPSSEIGGVLVTLASVKPDETIKDQPHPVLSKPWAAVNHVDDETKLDPVPVLMREVDAEIAQGSENTIAFYTGLNELSRMYVNYGMTRNTNPVNLEDKTAIWQVKLPASVTPENVVYPVIDQYPFIDQNAEICRCRIQHLAAVATPMVFGPTTVEEVEIVADESLLT